MSSLHIAEIGASIRVISVCPELIPTTGYAPNGNILSYSDCVTGTNCVTGSWAMTYTSLNQLSGLAASAGPWNTLGLAWVYDPFGNRTMQTLSGSPQTPVPASQSCRGGQN